MTEKPIAPADDDCCGGGACNPCVWDHYYAQLQQWRIKQAQLQAQTQAQQENSSQPATALPDDQDQR